jgi:hypothetical protein
VVEKLRASIHIKTMSRQEYEEFLKAMERARAERGTTREDAREVLKQEGLLTDGGELAAPYRPAT